MNSFLVLPACEEGRGGGHLYRSIALVKNLRKEGADAWLYTDQKHNMSNEPEELWLDKEKVIKTTWTLIILDRYRTEKAEIQYWAALGPVLGIDEGHSRKECDFLIDILPGIPSNKTGEKANLCAPSLLPLPKKRRTSFSPHNGTSGSLKILVSFGAEDAAGLTVDTTIALKNVIEEGSSISVVLGPLRKNNGIDRQTLEKAGVTVIEGKLPSGGDFFNLQETLADYDLIITHFGITAFEALYARVPVLLINPGAYHEKLSQHTGIPFIYHGDFSSVFYSHRGTEITEDTEERNQEKFYLQPCSPCLRASVREIKNFYYLYKKCVTLSEKAANRWGMDGGNQSSPQKYKTLSGLLFNVNPLVHRSCPLCGTTDCRITERFPGRTYRMCNCGTIIMDRLNPPPVEYNQNYFFSEYQKQYGKTYLDDFPKLQKDGERRTNIIGSLSGVTFSKNLSRRDAEAQSDKRNSQTMRCTLRLSALARGKNKEDPSHRDVVCLQTKTQRLLDIGCAYGPFLAAAREQGFEVMGIDPAQDAVDFVKKTLGINAIQGTFPEFLPELRNGTKKPVYDAITLWYVIEHFEDTGKALTAINGLLKTGGVLAFSTPSAAGISRRKSLYNFLENSPADHWTILDPRRISGILNRYGFRLKKRIITGHHPERFPFFKTNREGFFSALSRIFGLGDTFEVYAVKVRDCNYV
ncbi:MAG: methyltransferase domain-containing protein [Treponema sp.]|nr:methyltransferase domain-containing protein [Treponema sp.]